MLDKCNIPPKISNETEYNRERVLILSSSVLKKMEARMTSGPRFREQKSDQTYLGYVRALSGLIQAHNAVLKDQELTDLEQRLKALEEREAPYKERVYE